MLMHPTLEKLRSLQLRGMAAGLEDQLRTQEIDSLSFEEHLGLLLDREATSRADRRLKTRLTQAKLRVSASLEDVDHAARRNLDKSVLLELAGCSWIARQ
jgi:DNA replication protein DnaC